MKYLVSSFVIEEIQKFYENVAKNTNTHTIIL